MSHHLKLLAMAQSAVNPATMAAGRPSQAVLRRSVSTAYYALFHFVGDAAARQMVGSGTSSEMVARRHLLRRTLSHDQMTVFCRSVAGGTLGRLFQLPDGAGACFRPGTDLRDFARVVVRAKEQRQRADYDLNAPFDLSEARDLVEDVARAISGWRQIAAADRAMFLMCAVLWPQLKDR